MELSLVYLTYFIIYCIVILIVGLWGYRKVETSADFAVAGRSLPLYLATATMVGTYISALTVIGGAGYASRFGWSLLIWYSLGGLAGLTLLSFAAKKIYIAGVKTNSLSVSQLIGERYDSKYLQAYTSLVIVFTYTVILTANLFGIGHLLSVVIGIPMPIALASIGIVFTIYASIGGMIAVARTDLVQLIIMVIGIPIAVIVVLNKLYTAGFTLTSLPELNTVWAGQTPNLTSLIIWTFAWGFGVAAHPYYVQRVFVCKDLPTVRRMVGLAAIFAVFFYALANALGIAGAILVPEISGDAILPYVLRNLIGGALGGILLAALAAGIMSTTDSILNIIGVYLSRDVYYNLINPKADDVSLLKIARICTLVFGLSVTALNVYMSYSAVPLVAVIGAYGWSIVGGTIFIPLYVGLFWKRATWEGAFSSAVGGLIAGIGFHGRIPIHSIVPAIIVATALMIVVSMLTKKTSDKKLEPFFEFSSEDLPKETYIA